MEHKTTLVLSFFIMTIIVVYCQKYDFIERRISTTDFINNLTIVGTKITDFKSALGRQTCIEVDIDPTGNF